MGALDGIRAVASTTVDSGPWATPTLGDTGADVMETETSAGDAAPDSGPSRNPGMAAVFVATDRNKRGVVLDLAKPERQEALSKTAAAAA